MKRTRTKSMSPVPPLTSVPDAILTGDWHLREDNPVCRTDDFVAAQWEKVRFIAELQKMYGCPVLHTGDLFNHWKPSPYLLSQTISNLPAQLVVVYGNHDLPQHNFELREKSGLHTLITGGFVLPLVNGHWGWKEPGYCTGVEGRKVALWHVMTWKGKPPWPGCADPSAKQILEKYPQYDLIVTGHNHKAFVEQLGRRLLVNPGSITRQTADQVNFRPRVYLWYAKTNEVKPVYLPIKEGAVTRQHIEREERRDARIAAFVERLNTDWEADVSFEKNLERFEKENNVSPKVMEVVRRAMEI